jgi:glucose-1-phosphate adenylyltransferase
MRSMMGVILTGGRNTRLKELSDIRSNAAIPVAGKYRAIDFALSNMVNSGVINIGVMVQYSFRSLIDHLGSGKEWDLDRRNKGLFIFPPYLSGNEYGWYRGSADAIYNNLTFLRKSSEDYVLVAQGNCIYKMDYGHMLDYHIQKGADITIAYRNMFDYPYEELAHLGCLDVDSDGHVLDFEEKAPKAKYIDCSMGVYIMRRELLIELVEECIARGNYDLVKDVLVKKTGVLNFYGYKFDGYWRNFSTISSYYRCNMELLNPVLRDWIFNEEDGVIYTKVKDEPPTKYNDEANVRNSIIADGCIIEGNVENSVIFRGVTIKKGSHVKDSIVMQGTVVEEEACLQNIIVDKSVVISRGVKLAGTAKWPVIIGKGSIV